MTQKLSQAEYNLIMMRAQEFVAANPDEDIYTVIDWMTEDYLEEKAEKENNCK